MPERGLVYQCATIVYLFIHGWIGFNQLETDIEFERRQRCFRFGRSRFLMLVVLVAATSRAAAQEGPDIGARLMQDDAIRAALDAARADEPRTIDDQVRLCEIPAPPFKEATRAKRVCRCVSRRRADERAHRPRGQRAWRAARSGGPAAPRFQRAPRHRVSRRTPTSRVTREGQILKGPGHRRRLPRPGRAAGRGSRDEQGQRDDARDDHVRRHGGGGRARRPARRQGAVQRDAERSDRQVRVGRRDRPRAFRTSPWEAIDTGSRSRGLAGHSYGAFGIANPVHALGRAIDGMADLQVPADPKTTFNVGRVGGGTSVNAIAFEAWMEVDMRSADPAALQARRRELSRGRRRGASLPRTPAGTTAVASRVEKQLVGRSAGGPDGGNFADRHRGALGEQGARPDLAPR